MIIPLVLFNFNEDPDFKEDSDVNEDSGNFEERKTDDTSAEIPVCTPIIVAEEYLRPNFPAGSIEHCLYGDPPQKTGARGEDSENMVHINNSQELAGEGSVVNVPAQDFPPTWWRECEGMIGVDTTNPGTGERPILIGDSESASGLDTTTRKAKVTPGPRSFAEELLRLDSDSGTDKTDFRKRFMRAVSDDAANAEINCGGT